jgi:hypothetical protein
MDHERFFKTLMTKRLAVYLPDGIFEKLEKWANDERRSASNLAAFLLEVAVRENDDKNQTTDTTDKP